MNGKIQTILVFIGIVALVSISVVAGVRYYNQNSPKTSKVVIQPQWGMCWEDKEERRCGTVNKITFYGQQKQVIKMEVFFPSTGVTTEFFRDPDSKIGIWVQPGDKGQWTLSPAKKGGYQGEANDQKGWQAQLVVEKLISIN